MGPNRKNSDRGIETDSNDRAVGAGGLVRTERIPIEELKRYEGDPTPTPSPCPNRKNSDRGIETRAAASFAVSVAASEPKEFRSRN